jgi:putative transcriptional regulator
VCGLFREGAVAGRPLHVLSVLANVLDAMSTLQGHLLVASPELRDPNFFRTVVLLVRHNDEGALGVILTRPSKTSIQEVWKELSQDPCDSDLTLHLGGPVAGPLIALHAEMSLSEIEIVPGVCFSADQDAVVRLVSQHADPLKLYIGYAGWGAGQLEAEMEHGSWRTTPATADHVFPGDEHLWERVLRQITGAAIIEALRIKHVPEDPSLN